MMADIFQHWLLLQDLSVANLPRHGDSPVVGARREARTKQILKFGSTDRLRRRIFGNTLGGVGGETTQRIHGALFTDNMIDHVDLAWLETKDKTEAQRKEGEFREAYKRANGHRPPGDRRG